ncbi:MAG: VWA domain-containing protein [Oscillospiraceae bacterium]|nr:VWA domain-containing protein [Oscillospiraceae bacterium]
MGITYSNKEVNTDSISCGGSFQVTLSLAASPDIVSNPADIVLILDRSGSMAGSPLANMKNGARKFIDIIDEATDSSQDGQIGGGSRIAVVSFADTATQDTGLITSVADLKAAVTSLTADGSTNHADAFEKALQLFPVGTTNQKVMVMFTDGVTTAGGDPNTVATAAKAQGVIIYCIGLSGNGGIDENALDDWASDPSSAYVAITPNDAELENLFEDLANNITKTGATNIVLRDTVAPCFRITSLINPAVGSATMVDSNTVEWNIPALGVSGSEGAALQFNVQHVGECTGTVPVNESVSYSDDEGNIVTFPSPEIDVDCGIVVIPESCPIPVDISAEGCSDTIEFDAGNIILESTGRILQLDVTVQNVCPGKRVALAVILNETDPEGNEYRRGMKTMTVPAHTEASCRDVIVRCIKFILPDDLDVSGTDTGSCNTRSFNARIFSHYIDSDFECCSAAT